MIMPSTSMCDVIAVHAITFMLHHAQDDGNDSTVAMFSFMVKTLVEVKLAAK